MQPLLAKYFRSDKYKALMRQLNIHGFTRKWACEKVIFSHIMFKRGHIEDLKYIKREAIKKTSNEFNLEDDTVDYDSLNRRRDSLLMALKEKERRVKEFKLRKIEKLHKEKSEREDKERYIFKMVHLLFRSKGLFAKDKIKEVKSTNPELGLVLSHLENSSGSLEDLSNVLNSVKDFLGFSKDFYKILSQAKIFDSGMATPYNIKEEEGIQMMVPIFKISPIKTTEEDKKVRETLPKKDLLSNSNFRTYIRESEKNLGREKMSLTSEFLF